MIRNISTLSDSWLETLAIFDVRNTLMLNGLADRLIETLNSLLEHPTSQESALVGGSVVNAGRQEAMGQGAVEAYYSSATPVRRIKRMQEQQEIERLQSKLTSFYDTINLSDAVDEDEVEVISQTPGSSKSAPVFESVPVAERLLLPLQQKEFSATRAWFTSGMVDDFLSNLERQYAKNVMVIASCHGKKRKDGSLALFERLSDPGQYQKMKDAFHRADLVFWPIVIDAHWHLIIVEKSETPIEVYMLDGFNTDVDSSGIWKDYAHRLVKSFMPELQDEEIIGEKIIIPSQSNAYDCGPAVCMAAKTIAKYYKENGQIPSDDEIEERTSDYTNGRLSIAKDLVDFHIFEKKKNTAGKKLSRQAKATSSSFMVIESDDDVEEDTAPSDKSRDGKKSANRYRKP